MTEQTWPMKQVSRVFGENDVNFNLMKKMNIYYKRIYALKTYVWIKKLL